MTVPPLPVSIEEFDAIVRRFAANAATFPEHSNAKDAHDDRGKLIELVRWWREAHADRAFGLLEANNREVFRRRAAEAELAELRRKTVGLRARIDHRMNDLLCETKPDFDDSLTGINAAWDVLRAILDEALL